MERTILPIRILKYIISKKEGWGKKTLLTNKNIVQKKKKNTRAYKRGPMVIYR